MIGHEPFSAAPHPHHHHDRFWRVVRLLWVLELDTSRIQPKAPPAMDGAFFIAPPSGTRKEQHHG
jgi:hypothetical protein